MSLFSRFRRKKSQSYKTVTETMGLFNAFKSHQAETPKGTRVNLPPRPESGREVLNDIESKR